MRQTCIQKRQPITPGRHCSAGAERAFAAVSCALYALIHEMWELRRLSGQSRVRWKKIGLLYIFVLEFGS